jgi:hypothetical protein
MAIRISGSIQESELTNTITEFLDSSFLVSDALISLKQMANKSLRQLIQMFYKTDIELNNQLALMDILGQIKSDETIQFLLENINHHKKEIRNKAIAILKSLNYIAKEKDYPRLFHAITQASQNVSWDISALAAFTGSSINKPIYKALHYEFLNHQNILMQLLAITYDSQSVSHVKDHLDSGTSEGVGYALELFDLFLAEEIKPFILAIFEDLSFLEKSKLLENFFPVKVPELNELIIQIINRDPNLISKTSKKLALYEYTNYYKSITDDLIAQVFSPEKELQALSAYIVKNTNPVKYNQIKQRLKPIARKNIENTNIDSSFPVQTVLTQIAAQLQESFKIGITDFIDFYNQVSINDLETVKNKFQKEQVTNYFVFLIYDQNGNSENESISRLFNNFDDLQKETGLVIGITKEALHKLMLTNKQIVHGLINLI